MGLRRDVDGLDEAAVAERVRRGEVNDVPVARTPSVATIVTRNVATRFNALLGGLFVLIVAVGDLRDGLFGLVLVANSAIGIAQEVRAKRALDRLAVVAAPKARVVRDDTVREVGTGEVVLDDVLEVRPGDQVVVDGVVLAADGLEVNESLLTGEAEPVPKPPGSDVLSGSFAAAGTGRYRATRVGADAYASTIAAEAQRFSLVRSELRAGIDRILWLVTWVLVPSAVLLVLSQLRAHATTADAISASVAGVVAMVPEGLVLLTSAAFAVAAYRLTRRRALVQELPTVEALARVDVVCLDKTGTLTEGDIVVDTVEVLAPATDSARVDVVLGALAAADPSPNATLRAVRDRFADPGWRVEQRVAFSSARRYAAATFADGGTWLLGAPEAFAAEHDGHLAARIAAHAVECRRTLLLARGDGDGRPQDAVPVALVGMSDRVRTDATDTLAYFAAQGVAVKVLSGDAPDTVTAMARRAGLPEAVGVDARGLPSEPAALAAALDGATVLGRVAPEQKRAVVAALQGRGHVVAMTGDGVNDVLALKQADVGVAMGSGTAAARTVSQLVLLDDAFATLPAAVAEGRRVISNIERVARLFTTKSVYALLLAVAVGIAGLPFPFLPRHLSLVAALTIGLPGMVLALERSDQRVTPGFLRRVLAAAVPAGLLAGAATFIGYAVAVQQGDVGPDEAQTAATLVLLPVGLVILARLAAPLTPSRRALVGSMWALFALVLAVPAARDFFALNPPPVIVWLSALGLVAVADRLLQAALPVAERVVRAARDRWPRDPRPGGPRLRRLHVPARAWRAALSVAVTVGIFVFVLPQLADFSLIWAAVVDMTWLEVATLLLAAGWNILTYLLVMVAVLPGLKLWQAFVVGQTSTAVAATLPAGSALGIGVTYSMYASMGHTGPQVALATVLTGVWNTLVKLGLPIAAIAVAVLTGRGGGAQVGVALLGLAVLVAAVAVFAGMLWRAELARRVGDVGGRATSWLGARLRRPPVTGWGDAAVRFRAGTIDLLRHRWPALTAATVVSHLSLYAVLLLALRHMDVSAQQVTWAEALIAFSIVRLASALPITPGGLGVVELLLVGALVLAGGARTPVVGAVLVFRFLTLVVQVLLGGACYLAWQTPRLRRGTAPAAPPEPVPVPPPEPVPPSAPVSP